MRLREEVESYETIETILFQFLRSLFLDTLSHRAELVQARGSKRDGIVENTSSRE